MTLSSDSINKRLDRADRLVIDGHMQTVNDDDMPVGHDDDGWRDPVTECFVVDDIRDVVTTERMDDLSNDAASFRHVNQSSFDNSCIITG
jgi:hypothetical protein